MVYTGKDAIAFVEICTRHEDGRCYEGVPFCVFAIYNDIIENYVYTVNALIVYWCYAWSRMCSLSLSVSLAREISPPPSLSLSLSLTHTHTHTLFLTPTYMKRD